MDFHSSKRWTGYDSHESHDEDESISENLDHLGGFNSLHSLCLEHGLRQQSETNVCLSYTLLHDPTMRIADKNEALIPGLPKSGSTQVE
jgi:hypothetical protein